MLVEHFMLRGSPSLTIAQPSLDCGVGAALKRRRRLLQLSHLAMLRAVGSSLATPPETASRRTCRTHGEPQRSLAVYSRRANLSCEIASKSLLARFLQVQVEGAGYLQLGDRSASSEANAHGKSSKSGQVRPSDASSAGEAYPIGRVAHAVKTGLEGSSGPPICDGPVSLQQRTCPVRASSSEKCHWRTNVDCGVKVSG